METLTKMTCVACRKDAPTVTTAEIAEFHAQVSEWAIVDLDGIADYRSRLHSLSDGPRFARIKIAPGNPERVLPPRDGVFVKSRFRKNLGYSVS